MEFHEVVGHFNEVFMRLNGVSRVVLKIPDSFVKFVDNLRRYSSFKSCP